MRIWSRRLSGLNHCSLIFYVSAHLEAPVGRKRVVLPFPISTEALRDVKQTQIISHRDILCYCPSGEANEKIYRLAWIVDYAREHPTEKITIIGNSSHPASYQLDLLNVEIIPYVERSQMPVVYKRHRTLIHMTTEDGLAGMVHGALLCGLKVLYNGKEMIEVPPEREPTQFAASFK